MSSAPLTVSLFVFRNKFSIPHFLALLSYSVSRGKRSIIYQRPLAAWFCFPLLWPVHSIVCYPPPSFLCAGVAANPPGFVLVPRPRESASDQLRPVISQWKPQPFLSGLISHYERTDRPARSWWRDAPIHNKRSGNCSGEYEQREEVFVNFEADTKAIKPRRTKNTHTRSSARWASVEW